MHRSIRTRLLPVSAAILCAATVSVPGWAKALRRERSAAASTAAPHQAKRGKEAHGRSERWDIMVTRADDRVLEGHVTRSGAASLKSGRLYGSIAGRHVSGSVTDPGGTLVATFVGTISRSGGISGSYHDRDGDAGRWSWEGPLMR